LDFAFITVVKNEHFLSIFNYHFSQLVSTIFNPTNYSIVIIIVSL